MSSSDPEFGRLAWQTRRGALELDIVLSHYLQHCYPLRSQELRQAYRLLLREDDDSLMDWLVRGEQPRSEFTAIVIDILQAARKLNSAPSKKSPPQKNA